MMQKQAPCIDKNMDATAFGGAVGVTETPRTSGPSFRSILFPPSFAEEPRWRRDPPDFFVDLNLDQIVEAITDGKKDYDLAPFFHTPVRDISVVRYRQAVMNELENKRVFECISFFTSRMRQMRAYLSAAEKSYYKRHAQRLFFDAAKIYCDAVCRLRDGLVSAEPKSEGLSSLLNWLKRHTSGNAFTTLQAETHALKARLSAVLYRVLIKDAGFTVRKCVPGDDYSEEVEATFAKFKRGAVKDYRVKFTDGLGMNHVEAALLDRVALLYPETFSSLDAYCATHASYCDPVIERLDREVRFYLAYLDHTQGLETAGLSFCYPEISTSQKSVHATEAFDLALAYKLIGENRDVVCNDFHLQGRERIIVVTGPNQGGKTTFARMFGQLHYLASLGCRVPGKTARLFLCDRIFTHFERPEEMTNLRGKLEDDLHRVHDIVYAATGDSVAIMNEIFTSTTLDDGIFLSRQILKKLLRLDLICVWVTFIEELAALNEKTVSMVSTVVRDDPARRTYRLARKRADGLAYAMAIAEKHRLTGQAIKKRLSR